MIRLEAKDAFRFTVGSSRDFGSCSCPHHIMDLDTKTIEEHEVIAVNMEHAMIQMCRKRLQEFASFVTAMTFELSAEKRSWTSRTERVNGPSITLALGLIARERLRQVAEEGWDADWDDKNDTGELARAAECYAANDGKGDAAGWPFADMWWKPRDVLRNLIRAGALHLAERDRVYRRVIKIASQIAELGR